MLCALILHASGGKYRLTLTPNDRFLGNFFMADFLTLKVIARYLREEIAKEIFFFIFRLMRRGIQPRALRLLSQQTTYYTTVTSSILLSPIPSPLATAPSGQCSVITAMRFIILNLVVGLSLSIVSTSELIISYYLHRFADNHQSDVGIQLNFPWCLLSEVLRRYQYPLHVYLTLPENQRHRIHTYGM